MKELEGDTQIKKILKDGMLEKAPEGMVDRIMATIAVSPARRLTIKAVEPKSFIATIVPLFTGILVAIAAFIKPESRFAFSLDQYISLNINPIWVAPILAISAGLWAFIFFTKRHKFPRQFVL